MKTCFSEPSYKACVESEYRTVADDFVAKVAPSLSTDLRSRLAACATDVMLRGDCRIPDAVMEKDPYLRLNQLWLWPELAAICPSDVHHRQHVPYIFDVWDSGPRLAYYEAARERTYVEGLSLTDWVWNCPMPLIRRWRDELLPDMPKRTRKVFVQMELLRHPDFRSHAEPEYRTWRDAALTKIAALEAQAQQAPAPRHLAWLTCQLFTKLDSYHSATNSKEGPDAYDELVDELADAAGRRSDLSPISEIDEEIAASFHWLTQITGTDSPSKAPSTVKLAKRYVSAMSKRLTPDGVREALAPYRPGKLVPTPCKACLDRAVPTVAHRAGENPTSLAPYHLLCTCSKYQWFPLSFTGSEHDWHFGPQVDRDAKVWALDRLLGRNKAELNRIALSTSIAIKEFDIRLDANARSHRGTR